MKYDYGDDVLVKALDQKGSILARPGTVVGISSVEDPEQARAFEYPIGTVLYTVEFGDGSDDLIPEDHLAPLVSDDN
jgi:hypothetical protein